LNAKKIASCSSGIEEESNVEVLPELRLAAEAFHPPLFSNPFTDVGPKALKLCTCFQDAQASQKEDIQFRFMASN
jgi:hypothetical protein